MATIPANCTAVTQQLLQETGRLQAPMFRRLSMKRPILGLVMANRGTWTNGMGTTVGAVTFERSFPALTGDAWGSITPSDGTNSACLPPSETVSFGETTRTYGLRQYAIDTQQWCIRDIQVGWQFAEFLGNVTRALDTITEWSWYRRFTQDYFDNSLHNLTLNAALGPGEQGIIDQDGSYSTANPATAGLSQGVLDFIYSNLMREGGGNPSGTDMDTGAPVFTLITSAETSRRIIINNPDLRQDVRFAWMGKGEMAPTAPGVYNQWKTRQYAGFVHKIDPYPRRFILSAGAYVEIAPFLQSATTKGFKWDLNPAYLAAPYEESIIWHNEVYQDLTAPTMGSPAAGWNFNPQTFMGDFTPRNILSKDCNPDGLNIYMRALFASAAKPINPYVGWTILHARCGLAADVASCYNS